MPKNIPFTGDLFKKSEKGKKYLLNIRPECDLIRKENPTLYSIEGEKIDESRINSPRTENKNKIIHFNHGFIERENKIYLPFVDNGKIIEFSLDKLSMPKWADIKEKRIGKIIPPYITRIQQKYSFYLQRQGLPAIPEKSVK